MLLSKLALVSVFLLGTALPVEAQTATSAFDPKGNFIDSYGTSFRFAWCGDDGTDLCGVLTSLKGRAATPENLAFVGKEVMHATRSAANQWWGSLSAGHMNADATITMVDRDTIEIQGCRAAILCETPAYKRF
jgi:hypothetical protein